jgi:cyclopropane fatty-acyl-phospholipid synthase-like methyltransferase
LHDSGLCEGRDNGWTDFRVFAGTAARGQAEEDVRVAMSMEKASRSAAHFERLYEADPDPWHFRSSEYEQAKYQKTIEVLGPRRFRSVFEVGCSIGVLTRLLALRCDALLAVDIVEQPLKAARTACADQPWVKFKRMQAPGDWPAGTFDLIVLSEVLYFLSPTDIDTLSVQASASLESAGLVLLVNWRGRSADPCSGEEAAGMFIDRTRGWLEPRACYQEIGYRLDLLARR